LGEFGVGGGKGDFESVDFSEPSIRLRFGDPLIEVATDVEKVWLLGWIGT